MERVPVESTSLRSVGYDLGARELEVEFSSGRIYSYAGVPPEAYDWLMRSKGKGGYFNARDRPRSPPARLAQRDAASIGRDVSREATWWR